MDAEINGEKTEGGTRKKRKVGLRVNPSSKNPQKNLNSMQENAFSMSESFNRLQST